MVSKTPPKNATLNQILHRAKNLENHIGMVDFYHILRANNKQADSQANERVQRIVGHVKIDGITSHLPIP